MIGRSQAQAIMEDARIALEAVAKKHNTTLGKISASYEVAGVKIGVQFNAVSETGESLSREFQALKREYPTLAGQTMFVTWQGRNLRVTFNGYNSNAPTYPIMCIIDGSPKKAPRSLAQAALITGVPVKVVA